MCYLVSPRGIVTWDMTVDLSATGIKMKSSSTYNQAVLSVTIMRSRMLLVLLDPIKIRGHLCTLVHTYVIMHVRISEVSSILIPVADESTVVTR